MYYYPVTADPSPLSPCGPLRGARLEADEQARSGCVRQTLQRPHRRVRSPAFQPGDHRLRRSHFLGQCLLREPGTDPRIHHGRSQNKFFLKRLLRLPVLRLLHPLLVHLRYTCHSYSFISEPISRERRPALSRGAALFSFSSRRPARSPRAGPRPSHTAPVQCRYGLSVASPTDALPPA